MDEDLIVEPTDIEGTLADLPEGVQTLIKNLRTEVTTLKKGVKPPAAKLEVPPNADLAELAILRQEKLERANEEARKTGDVDTLLTNLTSTYEAKIVDLVAKAETSSKRADTLSADIAKLKLDHDAALTTEKGHLSAYQLETKAFAAYVTAGPNNADGADAEELFGLLHPKIKSSLRSNGSSVEVIDADGNPRMNAEGKPMSVPEFFETLKTGSTKVFFAPPPQSTGSGKSPAAGGFAPPPAKPKEITQAEMASRTGQVNWAKANNVAVTALHDEIRAKRIKIV
jgi:hypothetical protein